MKKYRNKKTKELTTLFIDECGRLMNYCEPIKENGVYFGGSIPHPLFAFDNRTGEIMLGEEFEVHRKKILEQFKNDFELVSQD